MKKSTAALAIAAAGILTLAACGSDDGTDNPENDSVVESADSTVDKVKLAAFVAAFRTGYSELARDRSDADIEKIVTDSCARLAAGTDRATVTVELETLAAHAGTTPTPDQAENIYRLLAPACP